LVNTLFFSLTDINLADGVEQHADVIGLSQFDVHSKINRLIRDDKSA
jgi:hypothetical protein